MRAGTRNYNRTYSQTQVMKLTPSLLHEGRKSENLYFYQCKHLSKFSSPFNRLEATNTIFVLVHTYYTIHVSNDLVYCACVETQPGPQDGSNIVGSLVD